MDTVTDESDTTDNCSGSVKVDVEAPKYPDLEVGTPLVDDAGPEPGATFTMSVEVSNTGDGEAPSTTLRYYRSMDGTITTADTEVGTDAVAGLAASGSDSQSVELVAPSAPGPYYYGACVETVAGESDTANNCSTAVEVTVLVTQVQIQGSPDLEVGTPTVSDAGPAPGGSFTLSATVSNAGDGESAATTLRYYRSTDGTITTSDTAVGTDAVGALAASGTSAESISLTAPATAGAYYYGACVDAVTDESDTADNCSDSVKVDVEAPKYPDLVVGSPTVSDDGPGPGGSFTLSATVSNTGDGESPATTLHYYRSADATITTADTAVGTADVGVLSAAGSSAELISLTAPLSPGPYYYGACVDEVADELNTTNNCSPSVEVTVLQTLQQQQQVQPDLVVGTPTVSDSSPTAGTNFLMSATVSNTGDGESPATGLRYYRSTDATIATSDTEVGFGDVGVLSALGTSADSIWVIAPATAGAYYYGACVDAVTDESDTSNNCSAAVQLDVAEPQDGIDLAVDSFRGGASPETAGYITMRAIVNNNGDAGAPATTLRFYRSTDATITTSDTEVHTTAIAALAALGSSAVATTLTHTTDAGTYYYGACVDAVAGESDTTNNCSTSSASLVVN